MHDLNKLRLGKSPNEVSNIETRQEVYDAVLEITKQSSKKIAIISKDLEPLIYNQSDFLEALNNMALNGRRAQSRILVSDVESIRNADHRLLYLSSKLPSFIELRKIWIARSFAFTSHSHLAGGSGAMAIWGGKLPSAK